MNVLSEYSLLFLVGLVFPVFGENAYLAEVCAKCCPTAVYFNATFNQCQMNVTEPVESGSGGEKFSVCPISSQVTDWHSNVDESFGSSIEYQRAGEVFDESQLIQNLLLCPKAAKIPVTKCCPSQSVYEITMQNCFEINSNESGPWPTVRSSTTNQLLNSSAQDFQVTTHLIQCPNGTITQISTEFTLLDDGTVEIPNITTKFSPGEVCIANSFHSKDLVARFCVPDPCTLSSCVRKCCPQGFVMNSVTHSCEPANIEFSVDYRNESGHNVTISNKLPIRSGVIPSCDHLIPLDPEINKRDNFNILQNGSVHVPAYPEGSRVFDDYCIDDFKVNTTIVSTLQQLKSNFIF
jgi:Methuselah N-terminus